MILLNHADSRTAEDSLVARERAVERESERAAMKQKIGGCFLPSAPQVEPKSKPVGPTRARGCGRCAGVSLLASDTGHWARLCCVLCPDSGCAGSL